MSGDARLNVFSVVFSVSYLVLFFVNEFFQHALFGYYPVLRKFARARLPLETAGPVILWYGWLAGAFVLAAVATLVTPKRLAARLGQDWVWQVAVALLVIVLVYERRWFY